MRHLEQNDEIRMSEIKVYLHTVEYRKIAYWRFMECSIVYLNMYF